MPTHAGARAFLESIAKRQLLITYQELANALRILPLHSTHRVTEALERLMEKDAAADRPFIDALAISKARGGLPGASVRKRRRRSARRRETSSRPDRADRPRTGRGVGRNRRTQAGSGDN